jgi:hypothetical protein
LSDIKYFLQQPYQYNKKILLTFFLFRNTIIHTMSMNIQRITISLPIYLYQRLTDIVPKRKVSSFIASALEEKIITHKVSNLDPIDDFFALRKKTPKLTDKSIISAISKGRKNDFRT